MFSSVLGQQLTVVVAAVAAVYIWRKTRSVPLTICIWFEVCARVVSAWPPIFYLGAFSVTLPYIALAVAVAVALLNPARRGAPSSREKSLASNVRGFSAVLFGIVLAFSFVRGALTVNLKSAVVEATDALLLVSLIVALVRSRLSKEDLLYFARTVIITNFTAVLVTSICSGLGSAGTFEYDLTGDLVTTRPIVAGQALCVFLSGLTLAIFQVRVARDQRYLYPMAFVSVMLSQHRTVYVAAMASLFFFFIQFPRSRSVLVRNSLPLLTLGLPATAALVMLLWPNLKAVVDSIGSQQTLNDRYFGWAQIVSGFRSLNISTQLVGIPFGSGWYRRSVSGEIEVFQPHNYYVTVLVRFGWIGFGTFLFTWFRGLNSTLRLTLSMWIAMTVFCGTYFPVAYMSPFLVAVLFGVQSTEDTSIQKMPTDAFELGKQSTSPPLRVGN